MSGFTLYDYNHCPYCVIARSIFGLKNVPHKLVTLLNDDEATPIGLVGAKQVPILQFEDGKAMPESMDIVKYIDANVNGPSVLEESDRDDLKQWIAKLNKVVYHLCMPRWIKPEVGLEEFKTEGAINYFVTKKTKTIGDFDEALKKSDEYIAGT
eukprot:Colp12_sorted_trinity150504_noHs@20896